MRVLAAALCAVLAPAGPAGAWRDLYAAAPVAAPAPRAADPCVRAILDAQARHGIPGDLLLAIGLQEAGTRRGGRLTVWPWAVNAAGEGRLFDTRAAAEAWVHERRAAGVRSIDVGCLQVNLRWHADAFARPEDGFDPARNADYAARFLADLRRRTGSWRAAAGAYHSFTPDRRAAYLAALDGKIALMRARRAELVAGAPQAAAAAPRTGGLWGGGGRSLYARAGGS